MSLATRLAELIRACFPGIWIQSFEHSDAVAEIAGLCREQNWRLATWDIDRGLTVIGQTGEPVASTGTADPLAAIRALNTLSSDDSCALLVLKNFHRFLGSAEVVQAIEHQLERGKHDRTFIIVLSPIVQIPVELDKQFLVIEHDLPNRAQLAEIATHIATEPGELPNGDELTAVLDAAAGLTRYEAEGAFSLSLVRHGKIAAPVLWEIKTQLLKKSGLLSLHRGTETFADLGGLEALKAFCRRSLRRRDSLSSASRPRGILLLSPPGCGKSAFCKALGNETGRPTISLDIGSLLGSLVGQSEQNIRQALRIADAMAPCILYCDEIEKALSGVATSGQTDSGVSARLFGSLLTWLNDHASDVYFVGTCNDISKLPPEFSRAERFDGIFFVDLPGAAEQQAIWQMYRRQFGLEAKQPLPVHTNWTGAEIRACCRLASLLDLSLVDAAKNIVPVAVTAAESVQRLRTWANGRCLSADRPGIYQSSTSSGSTSRRRVTRDISNN